MNSKGIGIIDFDLISTKKLCSYNFGVLLVSSYYQLQGVKVRLIIDLSYENLVKYEKIFVFKDYKTKIRPIDLIKNYYSLPIEEYGEGLQDAPLLPDLPNLIYTQVKTDIYKPLLYYINNGGKQFELDEDWHIEKQLPIKFFFEKDGELLLRQDTNKKRILVYDDPLVFFTTELGKQKITELLKRCIIRFVKPLRIGCVRPEWYDIIMKTNRIVCFKTRLYSDYYDPYLKDFINWCKTNNSGNLKIAIRNNDKIEWFIKKGGEYYGKYGNCEFTGDGKEGLDDTSSKENISIRHEWFTTKRFDERNRNNRERTSEKESRRKFLPSEYEKRRRDSKSKYNAIRSGKW